MLNTLGIVQVGLEAARPCSKVNRRVRGKSVMELIVRRVTDCMRLDGVVVALGDTDEDHRIADLVPPDVPVCFGREPDMLARIAGVLTEYPTRSVVRVCANHLFIDPVLIDRLITLAAQRPNSDYIGFCLSDGKPAILSSLGMFAEWCSSKALLRANQDVTDRLDRQQVTLYLYSHPEFFNIRLIPVPSELDREDIRLAIDREEDWEHAQVIIDALGAEECNWQRIAGLLNQQPAMRKRMADLNQSVAEI